MILDIDQRTLTDGDVSIHLTLQEAEIIGALAVGAPATYARLISAVYSKKDEPDTSEGVVRLLIHRIRRKIKNAGWQTLISNQHGHGYVLSHPIEVAGLVAVVVIPGKYRADLERLLFSHHDHVTADRIIASFVVA